jgi:hypothetical protein
MINQSSFISRYAVCNWREDNVSSFRISRDGITLRHRGLSYARLCAKFHLARSTFAALYVSRSIPPSIPPLRVVETRLCFHRWRVSDRSLHVLIIQAASIKCSSLPTSRKHSNSCVQQRKLLSCQLAAHSSLKSNGNCIWLLFSDWIMIVSSILWNYL